MLTSRGTIDTAISRGQQYWRMPNGEPELSWHIARKYLNRAREILQHNEEMDFAAYTELFYTLMQVEMSCAYNKRLSLEERGKHLATAAHYGQEAFDKAIESPEPGDLAFVKLAQGWLRARQAEFARHTEVDQIRLKRLRSEAMHDMEVALLELETLGRPGFEGKAAHTKVWRDRLSRLQLEEGSS